MNKKDKFQFTEKIIEDISKEIHPKLKDIFLEVKKLCQSYAVEYAKEFENFELGTTKPILNLEPGDVVSIYTRHGTFIEKTVKSVEKINKPEKSILLIDFHFENLRLKLDIVEEVSKSKQITEKSNKVHLQQHASDNFVYLYSSNATRFIDQLNELGKQMYELNANYIANVVATMFTASLYENLLNSKKDKTLENNESNPAISNSGSGEEHISNSESIVS